MALLRDLDDWVADHFGGLLGLLGLGVLVALGYRTDWSAALADSVTALIALAVAVTVVGLWHVATRRRRDR